MYIIHLIVISINSHQTYINISTQQLNNYITHQSATKQWLLATANDSLAAVGQHTRCSDSQARCSVQLQHLGFLNPSLFVAVKTILAAVNALYLSQPKHKTQNTIHCSQYETSCYSENHTRCSECSQHQRLTNPRLLVQRGLISLQRVFTVSINFSIKL